MGTKERSFAPLINVSLEDLVPADHFYRHLDRTLDLSFVREFVQQTYAGLGRPSIDPVVFFKLQLVMFFEDIRSERLLMQHAADRLSVRWYVGYDLDEPLPDHSSLSRIRTRYGIEAFRRFFEKIVEQCQQAGLVWGKELYVDATKVKANASLDSLTPRFAVEAHLAHVFAEEAAVQAEQDMTQEEEVSSEPSERAEVEVPIQLPVTLSQEERETLALHNEERHDWLEELGAQDRSVTGRSYQRIADLRVSTTDPDATIMLHKDGSHLGYQTHYVVDGGKARIILTALVTPAEVMENQPMLDLIFRTRFRWKLWPRQVTGDTKYGTEENIVALENQHIRASANVRSDTLQGLKPRSFCTVTRTDVFSLVLFLPTSYTGMRQVPYADGGCHVPNYERDTKFLSILFPDVDGSHSITMERPPTVLVRAAKHAPFRFAFATMTAHRARARSVVFVL